MRTNSVFDLDNQSNEDHCSLLTYWQEEDSDEGGDDVAAAVQARVTEGDAAPVLEMLVPAPAHDRSCSTDSTV